MKLRFARDERVKLADDSFAEIDMLAQMLCQVQMYDKTEHPLGNNADDAEQDTLEVAASDDA